MEIHLKYTHQEALQYVKEYYPTDYQKKLDSCTKSLEFLAKKFNITVDVAFKKYVFGILLDADVLVFFATLGLIKKTVGFETIAELYTKREQVAQQLFELENNDNFSYEDKKILRGFYIQLQQTTTKKINEQINDIQVVEPNFIGFYKQRLN